MARLLKRKQWDESDDPIPLLEHLGRRGCTLDFVPLVDVFLIRVWRNVSDDTFRQVLYEWFGTGQTDLTQDEANAAAEDRIKELSKQLRDLESGSVEYRAVSREIELGKALLVFDGSGFEETMTELCQAMAAVAGNSAKERRWQADTIRGLFDFNYNPTDEQ